MSFLYDSIIHEKSCATNNSNKSQVSKYDMSAVRLKATSDANLTQTSSSADIAEIPDSLIPDEYKVVTNNGVVPLTIEQKYKHNAIIFFE